MKGVGAALGLLAVAIVVFAYIASERASSAASVAPVAARGSDDQAARLAVRVEELQRSVVALKAQLAAQQSVQRAQCSASRTLPQVSAEHIDPANGRGAMVLYMSSRRLAATSR
jgi:hypothetical protein